LSHLGSNSWFHRGFGIEVAVSRASLGQHYMTTSGRNGKQNVLLSMKNKHMSEDNNDQEQLNVPVFESQPEVQQRQICTDGEVA
jgi:hypothetical protein